MTIAQPIGALVAHGLVSDRARLIELLRGDREFAVIGEATGVDQAVAMTRRYQPHVVVIGLHLPSAGGLEATRQIMAETPTPIVVVADDADAMQAQMSFAALRAGAVAVIPKPWIGGHADLGLQVQRFVSTVKALSQVKVIHHRYARQIPAPSLPPPSLPLRRPVPPKVVAIAASTGGPAALQQLLSALPANFPAPILVVQHMAPGFVHGLADALDRVCALNVRMAIHGEPLSPQTVFMAPDAKHLGISIRSRIALSDEGPVSGFRPSATVLFESVAKGFGESAVHVILTGMGRDGVEGLATARRLGGRVLAQDKASSVVFGMPGEAVDAGVVDAVVPLAAIAKELVVLTMGSHST